MTAKVFRDYDREALDREYDNRRKVADSATWLARYAKESARAREELACRLDVAYGTSAAETLDIFPAGGPGPVPIQVFIHGGYWHRLDKSDFSFVARTFQPLGVAVVVINYALIPSVDMDELVRQCRAAIAWTYEHAASFGGDPERVFVSGHSAGGHLVAMAMVTDWSAFGVPSDAVKAGCGISGLYDLEPIRLCYLNDVLALTPDAALRATPIRLVPPRAGSLLLAVGGDEGPEYHRQTDEMARAWRARGHGCEVMHAPGLDHFSIVAELERADSTLARAIQRQMGV